jgi:hypothetical protein
MVLEMEKDNFLRLYWCDELVGRIYDPWHYDFPRACGRFEPVNTDSEVYFFLVCLSEANREVDPGLYPCCERFPEGYFKGWSLVNPDGITQQISFPDPEFDATSMTIAW